MSIYDVMPVMLSLTLQPACPTMPFSTKVCSGLWAASHAGLGSLATKIPLAVLAGILVNSGIDIIDKDYLKRARQLPWDTLLVLVSHDIGLRMNFKYAQGCWAAPRGTLPVLVSSGSHLHTCITVYSCAGDCTAASKPGAA